MTINIQPVNDRPRVENQQGDVFRDEDFTPITIDISGVFRDVDGDTLALAIDGNDNPSLVNASLSGTILTLSAVPNANGAARITLRATDPSGETVTDSFALTVNSILDPPVIEGFEDDRPLIEGTFTGAGLLTNDALPLIFGNSEAPSTVTLRLGSETGVILGMATANGAQHWEVQITSPLPEGDVNLVAVASDSTMTATSTPFLIRVDTLIATPSVTSVIEDSGDPTDAITTDTTPAFSGAGDSTDSNGPLAIRLSRQDNGFEIGNDVLDASGSWSINFSGPALVPDGTYTFLATATDLAGNVSAPTAIDVAIDTAPPGITDIHLNDPDRLFTPLPVQVALDGNATIALTVSDASFSSKPNRLVVEMLQSGTRIEGPIEVVLPAGGNGQATVQFTHQFPATAPKDQKVILRATDAAGNRGEASLEFFVLNSTEATTGSPSTPVFSTYFDINSALLGDLDPWTITFDKTTQTIWFTMEKAKRLGHFDPATGILQSYDLSGFGANAANPHGVFFDFDTHLTPRVWFVHRNGGGTGRLSYFDVADNQFVTLNFGDPALASLGVVEAHAVFVDDRGTVWVSSEHGNKLLEIRFDQDANGNPNLQTDHASFKVRDVPPELSAPDEHFEPHGLSVVVNENLFTEIRDGETRSYVEVFVWFSSEGATGRVALLRTYEQVSGWPRAKPDQWASWDLDTILSDEARAGHALFPVVEDNETPGNPYDDRIVFADPAPGGGRRGQPPAGSVRLLNPVPFLQNPATTHSTIETWRVPKLPGAPFKHEFASTVQAMTDREGNVFFADRIGGVGRFSPDQGDPTSTTVAAAVLTPSAPAMVMQATLTGSTAAVQLVERQLPPQPLTSLSSTIDLSRETGYDQYIVAGPDAGDERGQGIFRSFLNATNVLYGSLAQNNALSTTVFAETARRQVAAVESPNQPADSPTDDFAPGAMRGRMVFQTLRDGSLVVTARPDGSILDQQINLSSLISRFGSPSFDSLLIDGDPSAVVAKDEKVLVFGKSQDRRSLVVYEFNVGGANWTAENLRSPTNWRSYHLGMVGNPAVSGFPVGDPTAFVDEAGNIYAFVTSNTGHLLVYSETENASPRDLSKDLGTTEVVFASVGVVEQEVGAEQIIYVYGTNQQGHLIEFAFKRGAGIAGLSEAGPAQKVVAAPSRDHKVFQDVTAIVSGNIRHVFATDGNSRLVHFQISGLTAGTGTVEPPVNVSQDVTATLANNANLPNGMPDLATRANDRAFGYFDFQNDYAARVYSGLAAVEGSDGALYVYGTNGKDFIEFKLAGGAWTAANLTNDVLASSHQPSDGLLRQPANEVFGAPAAYVTQSTDVRNGDRHILQINADGEVVEYYRLQQATQFQTQNVSLRLGNSPTLLQGASSAIVLAGSDAGGRPLVRGIDQTLGGQVFEFPAYGEGFRGGVRVAAGDVNGDGIPDIITGAGPGGGPHVRVFDGRTQNQLPGLIGSFMAYNPAFTGGVFVASGDIDGDGRDDVITGADAGGGPHVRVFSGATGAEIFGFFAYDARFTGGVRVASGDVNGDGRDDVVTGAGPGGGPHVRVFDGFTRSPLLTAAGSFYAYNPAFSGGVFVATGGLNADGKADIITGAGAGGGPHVRAFSGVDGTELSSFFAFAADFTGGVRVASADVDGDGLEEILTAPGPGRSNVLSFEAAAVAPLSSFAPFGASILGSFIASAPRSVAGAPLRLASDAEPSIASAATLSQAQLAESLDAAFAALGSHGLSVDRLAELRGSPIRIADLPPGLLGLYQAGEVLLDINASGMGWFVDPTPDDDEEFLVLDSAGLSAATSGPAAERVDLQTVILHELAHALGANHAANGDDSLMAETVRPGVRRLLSAELVDLLLAQ